MVYGLWSMVHGLTQSTFKYKVKEQKKSLLLFDQVLKCLQVFFKCAFPFFRDSILRIWFFSDKRFGYTDVFFFLEGLDVRGEVAIRYLQEILEGIKIITDIRSQHAHDLEPDPVLKCFIEIFQGIFHRSYL